MKSVLYKMATWLMVSFKDDTQLTENFIVKPEFTNFRWIQSPAEIDRKVGCKYSLFIL